MRKPTIIGGAAFCAVTFLGLSACGKGWLARFTGRAAEGVPDGGLPKPEAGDPFAILLWLAGICSIVAVGTLIASIVLPALVWFRRAAAACIGAAIGCWALWFLLDRFFYWAIGISVVVAIITGLLYLWGHRRWVEKRLNVDIDRDGHVGEPPSPTKAGTTGAD